MKKKILILYATYGNGHKAISQYIEKYFKKQNPELDILLVDILKYSTPVIGPLTQKLNDFLVLKFPIGWALTYKLFNTKISSEIASQATTSLYKNKRMKKIIIDFKPDLIISTHPSASSLVDFYKRKNILDCKLITVVTDYEAHAVWLKGHKTEDAIIVSDKTEIKYLAKKGINPKIIKPIGIPIHPTTATDFDIISATKKYGLSGKKPICLFFGGGSVGGKLSLPYIKKIIKSNLNIDFIFVSGKNIDSKNKVDSWIKKYNVKNIKTFGFVNNVPELLQICDFVISKPGGAQTTECLYFKKPIIMINCSGGQETGNYKYFIKNGYGRYFKRVRSFIKYIKEISKKPKILNKMKENMSKNDNDKAMSKLYKITTNILK